jgi:hypothetical protein
MRFLSVESICVDRLYISPSGLAPLSFRDHLLGGREIPNTKTGTSPIEKVRKRMYTK